MGHELIYVFNTFEKVGLIIVIVQTTYVLNLNRRQLTSQLVKCFSKFIRHNRQKDRQETELKILVQ